MSAVRSGLHHKVRKCFSIRNTLGVLKMQNYNIILNKGNMLLLFID